MNIRLNIDKKFKNSFPKEERFSEKYEDNWCLHQKNCVLLCQFYGVTAENITQTFRMTLSGSALTPFNSHFVIDRPDWAQVVDMFSKRYGSVTKQDEISKKLSSLRIEDFRKEGGSNKEALGDLSDRIATLYPLSLPTDRNDMMQKIFLKRLLGEQVGVFMQKKIQKKESYHGYLDSSFSAIRTI